MAWLTGFRKWSYVSLAAKAAGLYLPKLAFSEIAEGITAGARYLTVVVPMGIYNFVETMNNCESASAAGDDYNTRETMMVDGLGTLAAAVFGGCFPTTVYIGHPCWKKVGARLGYTLLNGIAVFAIALFGLMNLVEAFLPKEVAFVILLYIALVIGAQAFQETDRKYAPAVVLAFVPHMASFVRNTVDSILQIVGTSAAEVGREKFMRLGIQYEGLASLGEGAIITGLILAAMAALLIDRKFLAAAVYAFAGSAFAFFGFIHARSLSVGASIPHAAGYLFMALLFAGLHFVNKRRRIPGTEDEPC